MPQTKEEIRAYHREWNRLDRLKNPEKQRAVLKKSREKNYEKRLAGNRDWTAKNPEALARIKRKTRYGITDEIFQSMLAEQQGKCLICTEVMQAPAVDHCHDSDKVRGLLCKKCNSGIGLLGDSVENLERALAYLRKHKD